MPSTSTTNLFAGEAAEQFRLIRFQVYNWGTFSGLHDIAVSEQGQLFIGGSGSGKSTLLDAMSVLLTPPTQLSFNAAAREGEKRSDRTILSYMRGAWTTQQDEDGRSVTQYLRRGSTWSAIALTYKNDFQTVTLLFAAIIRGSTNEDNRVNKYYFVVPENLDIRRLEPFSEHDYDWRFIRKEIPEARSFPRFAPYCEHFRKVFGIEEETVFRLLHKAQSARNLGDLNQFLRKFMLDVPQTFDVADRLVNEFSDLYAAHESVVKARDQVAVLRQAREHYQAMEASRLQERRSESMIAMLEDWLALHKVDLIEKELPRARRCEEKSRNAHEALQRKVEALDARLDALMREYYEKGGDRVNRLQSDLRREEQTFERVQADRGKFARLLDTLKLEMPQSAGEFERAAEALEQRIESSAGELQSLREARDALVARRHDDEKSFRALREEIEAMEQSPINIPVRQQRLRDRLAGELGVDPAELPFAGELLQVKDGEAHWQGAIERVLHNFALSILVADDRYADFARIVDRLNLHGRLVYHRVRRAGGPNPTLGAQSLVAKLDIKQGRWAPWLMRELAGRFDYACVETLSEFRQLERAVTLAGQVKHNQTRHEKDDRYAIDDRTRWVLGFSNEEKLAAYKENAGRLAEAIARSQREIAVSDERQQRVHDVVQTARRVLDYKWDQIDTGRLQGLIAKLKAELEELLTKDELLKRIDADREAVRAERDRARVEKESAYSQWQAAETRVEELERDLADNKKALEGREIDAELVRAIDGMALEMELAMTLTSLSRSRDRLFGRLKQISGRFSEQAGQEMAETVKVLAHFCEAWPDAGMQLDPTIQGAPEFFEKLDLLEREGLPNYESRFKDLLNNQARQNLTDLYQEIDDERAKIKARLLEVNNSLARVVFNRSGGKPSHLRISVSDRNLPEVKEFKTIQRQIMGREIDTRNTEEAERYFALINSLVQKLNAGSGAPELLRWRERVLDVRQHVEFKGVEFERTDEGGERELEVYASGAGKSGGQRQKLTVTCLAAALRYQLGGRQSDYPRYATVILDEAFDKADSEFTDIALTIFKDFHFQLIIATPEKSVMTLDPYVGGTTFVSCRNRCESSVLNVVYDSRTGKFSPKADENEPAAEPAARVPALPRVQIGAAAGKQAPVLESPRPEEPDMFGGL